MDTVLAPRLRAADAARPGRLRCVMRHLLKDIEHRTERLFGQPFLSWLRRGDVRLEDKLLFAPVFVTFILGFRDMNRWFLRYPEPRDEVERALNRQAAEDQTHSRLFLEDFRKLGLDERLGWGAGQTLYWY